MHAAFGKSPSIWRRHDLPRRSGRPVRRYILTQHD